MELVSDEYFMKEAMRLARRAYDAEEVPIGAVVVREGRIIARSWNQVEMLKDATAHAEMLAITQAEAEVEDWRLTDCDLYVTKEPCPMCAGAILQARIPQLVYGTADPKAGAVDTLYHLLSDGQLNHEVEVTSGVLAATCSELLTRFFSKQRQLGKK